MQKTLYNILSKSFLSLFLVAFSTLNTQAQELDCIVVIDYSQVQTTNQFMFQEMEQTITEFLNQTIWTRDEYEPEERITCGVSIKISQQTSASSYQATAQIRSYRPIYGTDYESATMAFIDKDISFVFTQGQELIYNESGINTNLVSILAFYANVMIGLDYDSYSLKGGTQYFEKARELVNVAQNFGGSGWKQEDGTNSRYWIIDNILNTQFEKMRTGTYVYYREVFDQFTKDPAGSQQKIIDIINDIKDIRNLAPASVLIKSFFTAKEDELIQIFKGADNSMKLKAMNALIAADPTHQESYRKILER